MNRLSLVWTIIASVAVTRSIQSEPRVVKDVVPPEVEYAIKWRKERDTQGDKLLEQLNNPKVSGKQRVVAGLALGKMQYLPAIPSLIKHIGLQDASKGTFTDRESDPIRHYPCALELVELNSEVISPIIKKYVEEEEEWRRELLSSVILRATAPTYREDAIRYALGFGYELSDRAQLDRLIEIYIYLHKDKSDKPAIPAEWLKVK